MLSGVRDVKANTRAAAIGSASVLNSATGVMLPGKDTAPPINRTDLTRRKTRGSCDAARATLVNGPMAIRSIVSGGFSSRSRRISWWEDRFEALKSEDDEAGFVFGAFTAVDVIRESEGGLVNKLCHVSSGLV